MYRPVEESTLGIVDIETTGFFKDGGKVVEVGIAQLNVATGEITPIFDSLCREEGMSARHRQFKQGGNLGWIFENSSLTPEEVREAPLLPTILPKIQQVVDGMDAVTAFNKAFDFQFLRDRGLKVVNEVTCPMLAATDVLKLPARGYRRGYKWPKAQEAYDYFYPDEPFVEEHKGLSDAMMEAKIVSKLITLGKITYEN